MILLPRIDMSARARVAALLPLAALVTALHRTAPALERIETHDNDRGAGTLRDGVLTAAFEIRRGVWHPNGADRPGTPMLAFAEPGGALMLPGPMLRVPLGTQLEVTVRNASDSALVVLGLAESPDRDSLVLAAGETRTARFRAERPGNRFYYASRPGQVLRDRRVEDGHLAGALIVDGDGPRPPGERVLVLTASFHSRDSLGALTNAREIFAINGRPWPRTQRLTAQVGDSMVFRVLNATRDAHPMHLHGTYFRVDSRGTSLRDSVVPAAERRLVVTDYLTSGSTISMAWMPDRPGTWLLHCHLTFHVADNPGFGADSVTPAVQAEHRRRGHEPAHADEHVERAMGGLMMAIAVAPPAGWSAPARARRTVRFLVPHDSSDGLSTPRFAPALEQGGARVAAAAPVGPGATLLLEEGVPTRVRVLNGSRDHVAIHWHGMELESLFDGVVGLGGTPGARTHAVAPRDSFDALMTPPRAGTFMYHSHLNEIRQLEGGLYGPMIVLPRGARWDATHDHVWIAGTSQRGTPLLNGATILPALRFVEGSTHRLRLINVTTGSPGLRYQLVRADTSLVPWTAHAKDGMDLPPTQRRTFAGRQLVSQGETYDFLVTPGALGALRLELRSGAGVLVAHQPITVVPRAP